MERYLLLFLVVMIALSVLIIGGVGYALSMQPDYRQVDFENTMVVKDGDQYVLLVGSTLYKVTANDLVSGCYRLTEPSELGERGTAELAWPFCGRGN